MGYLSSKCWDYSLCTRNVGNMHSRCSYTSWPHPCNMIVAYGGHCDYGIWGPGYWCAGLILYTCKFVSQRLWVSECLPKCSCSLLCIATHEIRMSPLNVTSAFLVWHWTVYICTLILHVPAMYTVNTHYWGTFTSLKPEKQVLSIHLCMDRMSLINFTSQLNPTWM